MDERKATNRIDQLAEMSHMQEWLERQQCNEDVMLCLTRCIVKTSSLPRPDRWVCLSLRVKKTLGIMVVRNYRLADFLFATGRASLKQMHKG
ncbi:hypothetical protein OS493_024662 [Desmophyllum pertusum]|uniref:Uncharacterized protein n=1 Tax=Desmophyllum pertusum TaxID=174260 RepID=A0A9W9ZLS9_9CNID|nr:hypothetical protein OS493_024662 [Desmophyllum pertusum]